MRPGALTPHSDSAGTGLGSCRWPVPRLMGTREDDGPVQQRRKLPRDEDEDTGSWHHRAFPTCAGRVSPLPSVILQGDRGTEKPSTGLGRCQRASQPQRLLSRRDAPRSPPHLGTSEQGEWGAREDSRGQAERGTQSSEPKTTAVLLFLRSACRLDLGIRMLAI